MSETEQTVALQQNQHNPAVSVLGNRIATVGAFGVGKDYVLKRYGYTILGFADPLYAIAEYAFGTADKSLPGMREILQTIGQWGRGTVSEQYPLTIQRATFIPTRILMRGNPVVEAMRTDLTKRFHVDWKQWGTPDIWVDALARRIAASPKTARIAVSNVRFGNELTKLRAAGLDAWLVASTPAELKERRKAAGLSERGSGDTSEVLAKSLGRAVASADGVLHYSNDGDTLAEGPVAGYISGVIWNSNELDLTKYVRPGVPVFRMPRGGEENAS